MKMLPLDVGRWIADGDAVLLCDGVGDIFPVAALLAVKLSEELTKNAEALSRLRFKELWLPLECNPVVDVECVRDLTDNDIVEDIGSYHVGDAESVLLEGPLRVGEPAD